MLKRMGILSLLAAPAAIFVAFAAEEPQLRLLARISAGELCTEGVPVREFQSSAMPGTATTVHLGVLTFQVPADALSEGRLGPVSAGFETNGLRGLVIQPTERRDVETAHLDLSSLPESLVNDPAALRSAAYAATSGDISLWMGVSEVESLRALLEAKTVLCVPATSVEVIKGPSISGVMIIRECTDHVQIVLEYFSALHTCRATGTELSGVAYMIVDPARPAAMDLARAIIGSFSLTS